MESLAHINEFIRYVGLGIEYIGLSIVAVSVLIGLAKLPTKEITMEHVREHLARRIIFGLEFVIAADIILATVAADIEDIVQLGGIVFIRIMLGYALRKEVTFGIEVNKKDKKQRRLKT